MELWDLYTEKREKIGLAHRRGDPIPEGYYHLVVDVWLKNSQGKFLVTRRAATRSEYPLMYEGTCGSVLMGEDSRTGAVREVMEEVGIALDPARGVCVLSELRPQYQDIHDVWLFDYDGDPDLATATTPEVAEAAWMTREQVRALFDAGKMLPAYQYFFEIIAPSIG